jgi:ribosomal protein S18 acetylase RimI-like enzyme
LFALPDLLAPVLAAVLAAQDDAASVRCKSPAACKTRQMDLLIRPLGVDEWRLWRSLRMRAIEESPDAFRSALALESAEADEWWVDLIRQAAIHPEARLLIAEVDDDPIAMLFGRLDAETQLLDIGSVWVDPDVRRRGVGRGLVNAAMVWAEEQGAVGVELWVTEGNEAAQRLFEQFGFVPTGDSEPLREGSSSTVFKMAARIS